MRRLTEKKRHELDLLCRAGAGLAPIAPAVCRLAREMVGAEACALFWLDADGRPEGFFHQHSTAEAQELFLNEFDRLFVGPAEINVAALAQTQGARVGRLLHVPASYYRSNTFNLLVKASGHHHSLDLRVDVDGRARAVLLLFRTRVRAFDGDDAALLTRIEPYLQRALSGVRDLAQSAPPLRTGHLLLGHDGRQLLMLSGDAEALLKACTLVGQDVRLTGPLQVVPRFVRDLCERMAASGQPTAHRQLDIPAGRLALTACRLHAPTHGDRALATQTLVTLELLPPQRLQLVQRVLELELSPLQREIALHAGLGGMRADCERDIGVGKEALKKHLKAIYRAAGVVDWPGLSARLGDGARRTSP